MAHVVLPFFRCFKRSRTAIAFIRKPLRTVKHFYNLCRRSITGFLFRAAKPQEEKLKVRIVGIKGVLAAKFQCYALGLIHQAQPRALRDECQLLALRRRINARVFSGVHQHAFGIRGGQ